VGNQVRVKITKNKVAPPFKEVELEILFGIGIDKLGDLINVATDLNILQKSGSWYNYGEIRLGQGKEKTAVYLQDNPELVNTIREQVMAAAKGKDSFMKPLSETTENEAEVLGV
jgi:recombination protein RecA